MDRLYVSYEKYRRMIAEKKILHRLVQGVRILTLEADPEQIRFKSRLLTMLKK